MRVELSLEQIESYHESGFLVIEDLLDHEEVEHLRTILLEAVAKRGDAFLASDYFAEISSAQHRTLNEIETRDRQQPLAAFKKRRPSWVRMFYAAREPLADRRAGARIQPRLSAGQDGLQTRRHR
jgi:hypothetical protein